MELMTLHDILVAWQEDRIDYREAMRLARIDTLDELYEAADLSGVVNRPGKLTPYRRAILTPLVDA